MFFVLFSARKWFTHTFLSQIQLAQAFCCKTYLSTLVLLQKRFTHTFFVTKTIYALFCHKKNLCILFLSRKRSTCFFCRENDLRTSSGKFSRVESCHPESSDFLGLCGGDGVLVFVFISVFVFVFVCVISSAWGSFVVVESLAQLTASSCLSESLATASRSHAGLQRGGQQWMWYILFYILW